LYETRKTWLYLIPILLLTAAVYADSLSFPFVYDDHNQIVNNPAIQAWQYLPRLFSAHVWSHKSSMALYYRPIFMLWLMLNYQAFGLNPAGWHASTVALHLICTYLVYRLARRLTQREWVSLVAALLFGLYPAHVEAVDWVSGATEPLFAVFLISSFLEYLAYRDATGPGHTRWRVASLLLAGLAVFSKETGVVIPGIVFAYEWFFHDAAQSRTDRTKTSLRAAVPYLFVVLVYLAARTLALKTFAHAMRSRSPLQILATWPAVIAFYIRHSILPVRLSVFYNLDFVSRLGIRNFALPALAILAAGAAMYWFSRRSRTAAFLGAWIVLLTRPVLNLTIFGNGELVHDRYLYVVSAGFCILTALLLASIPVRAARLAIAGLLAGAYACGAVYEGHFWADGVSLNRRGLEIAPGNVTATHNLGIELMMQQREAEAVPYFQRTLEKEPRSEETLFALGLCYFDLDQNAESEQYLKRALDVDPEDPKAHLFLGEIRARQGQLNEAEAEIRRAIALLRVTGFKDYHRRLADVLAQKNDLEGALREYRIELENNPDSANAEQGLDEVRTRLRLADK
jgi:tetratricopeptide (TPR) repeat protein